MIRKTTVPLAAALVGIATGIAIGNAAAGRALADALPSTAEIAPPLPELVLPELTHAAMALASARARSHLDAERPWAAWEVLREYVADPDDAHEALLLLAARAAAGWDGWGEVRRLLRGRDDLLRHGGGEGLYLLARAHEAGEEWEAAAEAYRRLVPLGAADRGAEVAARLGAALARLGDDGGAAAAFAAAAEAEVDVADWMRALEAESRARAGDGGAVVAAAAPTPSAPVRLRQVRAEAALRLATGDRAGARERLAAERAVLTEGGVVPQASELALEEAALRGPDARALLLRVAADTRAPARIRSRAATRLGEMGGSVSAEEEWARAEAYEADARPGLAARSLRAAFRAGAPQGPRERLRLGRLLFEARDYRPAREVLKALAGELGDPHLAAEAELLAARSAARLGRPEGMAELRRLPERHPGTPAAGTAHFLLGDAATERAAAIAHYRRAAEIPAAPEAREAHARLGDRLLRAGDPAGAVVAWEGYVARYPEGSATAEIAYRTGVIHERAGRAERARAMYRAAIAAAPLDYHAVRAADRAGLDPLAGVMGERSPWATFPGDDTEAAAGLRRLDALHRAGLREPWREELEWQQQRLEHRPAALLALAEGLAERAHAVEAIRLGHELARRRAGTWDERLLRVAFPFPFRDLVEEEARRAGLDAYLLAALVRQESSFQPRARSRVGATGLSQIMPATGAWLAPSVDAVPFHTGLLEVPEVNLRMGARYLRDQLRRYDGRRDAALAAYNAGPGRADRWLRELPRDPDGFRDAIPFAETRHYVRIVLRNAVVYRRLYGDGWSPGLTGGS